MESSFNKSNQSPCHIVHFALLLPVLIAWSVTAELNAQVIVVPNELTANNGNATANVPEGDATARVMFIYDASHFAALSGPSLLTQFAFRPKVADSPIGPGQTTMRMYASTTERSVPSMSTTFSQNIGTNRTLVFDGTIALASHNLPGPGDTRQFDIVTPLTIPFLYNPADGNLVLDLQESSGSGLAFDMDAVTDNPAIRILLNVDSGTVSGELLL